MWLDNWHPCGPLMQQFSSRVVYDARSTINAKVADYVSGNNWAMPSARSRDLITICSNMPSYRPNPTAADYPEWVLNGNGMYTCKSVWDALRDHLEVVPWASLI